MTKQAAMARFLPSVYQPARLRFVAHTGYSERGQAIAETGLDSSSMFGCTAFADDGMARRLRPRRRAQDRPAIGRGSSQASSSASLASPSASAASRRLQPCSWACPAIFAARS